MTTQTLLGHGVWLLATLLAILSRPGARSRQAVQHRIADRLPADPDRCAPPALDRLPDHLTSAGQPLRILLSDASGPGAVLRDTLLTRPSTYDP